MKHYPMDGPPVGSPTNRDPRLNVPGHVHPFDSATKARMVHAILTLRKTRTQSPGHSPADGGQ